MYRRCPAMVDRLYKKLGINTHMEEWIDVCVWQCKFVFGFFPPRQQALLFGIPETD